MEQAGLVERDKAGRRTYRIGLTRQGRKLAQQLRDGKVATTARVAAEAAEDETVGGELLDLLKEALASVARCEERIDRLELEVAELRAAPVASRGGPSISRAELAELRKLRPTRR